MGTLKMKLTETQAAYLAGIMDGEGHISLTGGKKTDIVPNVGVISTTTPELAIKLDSWLQAVGIHFRLIARSKGNARHRPEISLATNNIKTSQAFLLEIRPYLQLKAPQADIVLEFLSKRTGKSKRVKYTERDWELKRQIQLLNLRGPAGYENRHGVKRDTVETDTQDTQKVMTQSDLHGDMQSVAETTTPRVQ